MTRSKVWEDKKAKEKDGEERDRDRDVAVEGREFELGEL